MKKIAYLLVAFLISAQINAQEEIQQNVKNLANEYENSNYNGVILVAKGSQIIDQEAFGYADLKTGKKNTTSTMFKTESTGKMFTAVAILQLAAKGKIDLQKTVKDYLPESKIKNADKMTIHHLLTHQSGLTSPWERPDFVFKDYTKDEWWNIIETNPLAFDQPGKGVYYSSSGYEVLSTIIEKVTGKDFSEYCKKEIFEKAGMKNTFFSMDTTTFFKNGARPYRLLGTKNFYEYPLNSLKAGGAGGWISCVRDYHLFAVALLNNKLLNTEYLNIMMTGHVEMPPGKYGYGLEIYKDLMVPGETVYGHNGGGMGYSCDLFFEPKSKTIVVTMLNMYGNSRFVTRNFMSVAFGNQSAPVQKNKQLVLFDLIEEKGLDDFSEHYEDYFKTIGIPQSDPFFLITFGDGFDLLKQPTKRKHYLEILKKIIPQSAVLYIQLGDIEVADNKAKAKEYYLKAKELSEQNEPHWLGEINDKLSRLN